jgi:hypothetical protein
VEPAKSTFIYVGPEQVSSNVVYRPSPQFGQALKPVYSLRKTRPSCHEAAAHERQHWHRGNSGATAMLGFRIPRCYQPVPGIFG